VAPVAPVAVEPVQVGTVPAVVEGPEQKKLTHEQLTHTISTGMVTKKSQEVPMAWFHDLVIGFALLGVLVTVWYVWLHAQSTKAYVLTLEARVVDLEHTLFHRPQVKPTVGAPVTLGITGATGNYGYKL
jgi:hypothetical protein